MGHNSSGLHFKIAEGIPERSEAVSVCDVAQQFGIIICQATGLLSCVTTDNTQTELIT